MRFATNTAPTFRRTLTLLSCAALGAFAASAPTSATFGAMGARFARTFQAVDTAHLHRVHCSCGEILEEGEAKGTLPGWLRAYVTVGAPIVVRFTITVRGGGTLSGAGAGKPKGNPPNRALQAQ
jgi:hypothetical protein